MTQGDGPPCIPRTHTCPEVDEVLLLERRHLLDDGPEPALEVDEAVRRLARLVVERRVADQRLHVDVAHLQEKGREKLMRNSGMAGLK